MTLSVWHVESRRHLPMTQDDEAISVKKAHGRRRSRRERTEVQRYDPVLGGDRSLRAKHSCDIPGQDASEEVSLASLTCRWRTELLPASVPCPPEEAVVFHFTLQSCGWCKPICWHSTSEMSES